MFKNLSLSTFAAMALVISGPVHAGTSVYDIGAYDIDYSNPKEVKSAFNKQNAEIARLRGQIQRNDVKEIKYMKKVNQVRDILSQYGDKTADVLQQIDYDGYNGKFPPYNLKPVPNMKDKQAQFLAGNGLIFELNRKIQDQNMALDFHYDNYWRLSELGKKFGYKLGNIDKYTIAELNALAKKNPGNDNGPNKPNNKPANDFPPIEEYQPPFNAHGPLPVDDGADSDTGSDGGSGNSPDHEGQELLGGDGHDVEDTGNGKGDDDMGNGKEPIGGGGGHKVPAPPVLGLMGMAMFAVARRRKKRAA